MVGETGCAGVTGDIGDGLDHRAALLHAGCYLRDRVSSDSCAASDRSIRVIFHDRGQHWDVVTFRPYHWIFGNGGVAWFGGPGALQTLF